MFIPNYQLLFFKLTQLAQLSQKNLGKARLFFLYSADMTLFPPTSSESPALVVLSLIHNEISFNLTRNNRQKSHNDGQTSVHHSSKLLHSLLKSCNQDQSGE